MLEEKGARAPKKKKTREQFKGPSTLATLFSHRWPRFCGGDIYSRRKPLFSSFGDHTAVYGSSVRQAVARPRHRQSVCIHNVHVAATCRPSVFGSATKTRPPVAKQSGQCARALKDIIYMRRFRTRVLFAAASTSKMFEQFSLYSIMSLKTIVVRFSMTSFRCVSIISFYILTFHYNAAAIITAVDNIYCRLSLQQQNFETIETFFNLLIQFVKLNNRTIIQ